MKLIVWGSGEDMEGDEGGETIVRRYYMTKIHFQRKTKKSCGA